MKFLQAKHFVHNSCMNVDFICLEVVILPEEEVSEVTTDTL